MSVFRLRGMLTRIVAVAALLIVVSTTFVSLTFVSNTVYADDNLLGMPLGKSGAILVCGGGDLPNSIYEEFLRLAGGAQARIVLIPSAYPYDDVEDMRRAFDDWEDFEVASFDFLHTDDPEESDDDDFVAPLARATGVWISGGAQERLEHRYAGRKVAQTLREVVQRGGVVAGYSAGAAAMSRLMIRHGSSTEAVMGTGLGLLERGVVDSHFSQRGRHTRLLNVLDDHPDCIGLGIDEATALVIRRNHMHVVGDSRATVMVGCGPGRPVVVYRLKGGDEADMLLVDSPAGDRPATVELSTLRP